MHIVAIGNEFPLLGHLFALPSITIFGCGTFPIKCTFQMSINRTSVLFIDIPYK